MSAIPILTTKNCYQADKQAIASGITPVTRMENAGSGAAESITARYEKCKTLILCGPGANGGDGYVIARKLHEAGWSVDVMALTAPVAGSDAEFMAQQCPVDASSRVRQLPTDIELIVDCLYGAGLNRALDADTTQLIHQVNQHKSPVVAIDLPSGIFGDSNGGFAPCIVADTTITFAVKKLAHVLEPERSFCGVVEVVDIGFPDGMISDMPEVALENSPCLWSQIPVQPGAQSHKHNRGRLWVGCGGHLQTGAARLAARAGLRIGAGWVMLGGSKKAMQVCAAHETSIVLQTRPKHQSMAKTLQTSPVPDCVILGPAGGIGARMRADILDVLRSGIAAVLDADALRVMSAEPEVFFELCNENTVLLPHEAEFLGLFPDLNQTFGHKINRVKAAASRAGCTVLLKGADSVIANATGRAVVNTKTSAWLATLGTGDVLAGMVGGLMAQRVGGMDATCAAVWIHGALGQNLGAGLIAEDLPNEIPNILKNMAIKSK
ncbi:NAD(P)H-hydrate epimerase / ADP-dependent (S)-NAD(P)H-hydrate dehydratase [hydrothermal vent metagenome]|uniref:Nicotinamide nucleotide repair protein n=1 Tax=hydrothermal vent metagenome TaxID=652676 RepID=A0A3B0REN8_9ZZZZ